MKHNKKLIVILGPTATGKTNLAVKLAEYIDGEIISADSRQVYVGMDIGTGKDLEEYQVKGRCIDYHLIDIDKPGEEYNVYEFQRDFLQAYSSILSRGKHPILCGGTGLYIESVLKGYKLIEVPEDEELRRELEGKSSDELVGILTSLKAVHNTTDTKDRTRLIRAIEIEKFNAINKDKIKDFPEIESIILGVKMDRSIIRERITNRLKTRLESGMIEEVQGLLNSGLQPEQLMFYGLEYKYITMYLVNEISYQQMFEKLNIAIHQFAKRQMTWFRRMERNGLNISWLETEDRFEEAKLIIENNSNF